MRYCIPARILTAAQTHPKRPAVSWREGETRHSLSYSELAVRIKALAAGLRKHGIEAGDRVLLLADNSPLWITSDQALQYIGAVDVPRGSDTLPEELDHMIRHAEARAAVVGTPKLLEALGEHRSSLDLVVLMEGEAEGALSLEGLIEEGTGEDIGPPVPGSDDLATIVYTSGTTGLPKGVPLTHGNILHNVRTLPPIVDLTHRDRFLTLLPAWHVYERAVEYTVMSSGAELVYTSRRRLKEDMALEAPTFLAAVPRILEAIYTGADRKFRAASAPRRALAKFLLGQSRALSEARLTKLTDELLNPDSGKGARVGRWFKCLLKSIPRLPFHGLGKILVYRKILRATGGRLRGAISGGGALPRHVEGFFDTVGLTILVGYGLTETSPVVACRRPERNIRGTIGSTLPETEVQVRSREGKVLPSGDEGVLWFRGPQVFGGYYKAPELTAQVLDEDGWFNTGDLGKMLPWGDIVFTGRAKETIVLSSGENVEPEPLELALLASRLILQVLVLGQDMKHLGAIVVPDVPALTELLGEEPRLKPGDAAEKAISDEVNRILGHRKGIRPSERIHAIRLIGEEFKVEDGTLTPTLKMRRDRIVKRHESEIEKLFAEA
jgi:long-chain acyl-CoA synthetase